MRLPLNGGKDDLDLEALVARRLNARIPDEISVIAVDDDPEICENCSPTLTCDHKVHDALELIRIKACEGLTAADVADRFGLSRRIVEMRFKAATGRTIGDMILERRFAVVLGIRNLLART